MKSLISFLVLTCIFSFNTSAEEKKKLYKWVDKDGNTHFSDVPHKDAEEIEMKLVPTTKIKKAVIKETPLITSLNEDSNLSAGNYKTLTLTEPAEQGVVRNNAGEVTLTASLQPDLHSGHSVRFFIDGKLIKSQPGSLSVVAEKVAYGAHKANFIIVDSQGKHLQSSKSNNFHLLNTLNPNIRNKNRAN